MGSDSANKWSIRGLNDNTNIILRVKYILG